MSRQLRRPLNWEIKIFKKSISYFEIYDIWNPMEDVTIELKQVQISVGYNFIM